MYPTSYLSILTSSVLNFASDRLLISISFSSFSGVLFCPFIWDISLCLFNLAASLCLFLCIRWSCFHSVLAAWPIVQKCTFKLYGAEPQVIVRVRQPMSPFCGSVWRRAWRGDSTTVQTPEFCLGGSCLPALALLPVTSMSPHMPLVPF